jgi:hypothetical protein
MSSRITPLQKNYFPINKASSIVRKRLSTAISYLYTICIIGRKGYLFEKKLFCVTVNDLGCITGRAEDGYFGKGTGLINLQPDFSQYQSLFPMFQAIFCSFLKKSGDSVRNTCGKQLRPNKGTELLVVV